ncbi:DTW domain-containing protein [Echinimonas agarilytica]|uniref:tRNA-uridine aminocarboxypropyltransferase n=2 Tax=Echinimonas agarilytica TaxID=1215918 RepID=A0AA42B9M2_9GAMM|nr:DTW domain-containing protein [Echinimonas agarilytica]
MPEASVQIILLMYQGEVFKPSNSGWLIGDVVAQTSAYQWSRTDVDPTLLSQLNAPDVQPFVVFPGDYAESERAVFEHVPALPNHKQPLFVLLDGSWREARKMFRKSAYLNEFPLLSFNPSEMSRFALRKASHDYQLATAEVAARVLDVAGWSNEGVRLDAWFDVYNQASLSEARRIRDHQ